MLRLAKWFAAIVVLALLVPVVRLGLQVVGDDQAFRRADLTGELVRNGRYDPAQHFAFERACTHSVGEHGDGDLESRGYTRLDPTTAQDPDMYWPLVLINDADKTYRILYGREAEVMAPGWVCNPRITLQVEMVDGRARAFVAEARNH
ncbi:hypothetical protein SSBR45G_24100 [Bradyrhizobium sp. SSBR45G]|nr:hypothetical protein SSBR45G_24100 [Bradyrhizobium sp. SSBR45G]GLH84392.1 hypothetical protein SSBR45R_18520 [Bradyrhizobium sp. SSBR45R]